ncbi:helix-turn-helix domain-containing protein [Chryseobacterium sp. SL1]|uniref:helix-turn-helix domain-containing protein n=1 Tax=Chryseobacterium sp. SL1 TaxID=2995159 RepID=UPI002274EBA8|nr:helix-turn-helix domain-containing protein [Chryseobacterium sp. SL1]MCY1662647.1 helix-turn-helix domain-containing protein [Chryseobacterium sp. SL1]
MKIKKICLYCGQDFIARTTVTKCCSDLCSKRLYKKKRRDQKIEESQSVVQNPKETHVNRINDKSYFSLKTLDYLTVKEASELLKCDRRTIYRLLKSGRLPYANLSIRRIRILKKDIDTLFKIDESREQIKFFDEQIIENTPLKDCFSIGQIQQEYNISETSLRNLMIRHNIPKFQKGKFVYVPKKLIQSILNKIKLNEYCG